MVRCTGPLAVGVLIVGAVANAGAQDNPSRSIALVLDASGSMNAKLASGVTRLDAAKSAVAAFVAKLDPGTRLSFHAYGHQSPTRDKNCRDTELLVGFDAVAKNRDAILAGTKNVRAQGYTPISYVLELAAADVGKEPGAHTVVLISDGKETCEGDPCAVAKALADANAKLVVHTIGFNVDVAARYQLQCIARVARGTYSDASDAADLGAKLGAAAAAPAPKVKKIVVQRPRPGKLVIKNPDLSGHTVTDAATGTTVAKLGITQSVADLPAGLYNVTFGPTAWKSIEVKAGETTVLDPGVIELRNASILGHDVLDWETGTKVGALSATKSQISVLPSTFTITFGGAQWTNVEVKAGERKVLAPGVIAVEGTDVMGNKVYSAEGALVGTVSATASVLPVPPGKYVLEVGDQKVPIELSEGQRVEISLR